ncbi:hypothetical protein BGW36DRAFT_145070 [Talaromyces proteolyticus]|uniref:Uncharacterized protein n=1 Tax=Talaromyces proteolyticus TaxID=1131652 RepID=A0AAD4Q1D9_9EURO|nr:uncharacterized protein BGW36DRAFT_145070 [Talaromyces proteolyticus]KAH8698385.1 hypothetical protein BGW36DRAFT_145070 [Talaromyces proteolyticus]
MADHIIPILLLPQHAKVTTSTLPLLKAIQKVLNESYTAKYCAHPEIFGTNHIRLGDPAQLAEIIGEDGFTIVLLRVSLVGTNQKRQVCEVVATGSVKDFGDEDVETYVQWSKNLGGRDWIEKQQQQQQQQRDGSEQVAEQEQRKGKVQKYEVTAFAVSPHCQASGLGAQVLKEIRWLLSDDGSGHGSRLQHIIANGVIMTDGLELAGSLPIEGIDLDRHKETEASTDIEKAAVDLQNVPKLKLVLMVIRELGTESYYQRRGFKTVWSGTVPVGMWDCRKECTMVYMEMELT